LKEDKSKAGFDKESRNLLILCLTPLILFAAGVGCTNVSIVARLAPFLVIASLAMMLIALLISLLVFNDRNYKLGWLLLFVSFTQIFFICGGLINFLVGMS
jgi:hypothetical protein